MAYTTINKSADHFNTLLYSGNGSARTVTGVGFQPDFFWIKQRSSTQGHLLWDVIRGGNYYLPSSNTAASAADIGTFTAASDGYSFNTDGAYNGNSQTYVGWNWKANGAGSSNTDGDITSTVSANTTSGFSIVKYTGNGSNDQRIGHGLGARPVCWMIKRTDTAADWIVYHQGYASNWYDDSYMYLNENNAKMGADNTGTGNPTSSVFYIGNDARTGASGGEYIAYVFAEKQGFSKFGSYTGNGNADGTFVYTGFKPAFVIMKSFSNAVNWKLEDSKRNQPFNDGYGASINANDNSAEDNNTAYDIDILSNGFKQRNTNSNMNNNGYSYIYMAFGQSLVGSNDIPATAR